MSERPTHAIVPGFANASLESQTVFRALLTAMSEPGRALLCPSIIKGAPLPPVLAAVALTLLDYETPIYLAGHLAAEEPRNFLGFHTGAPIVADANKALFVLALSESDLPFIPSLSAGTPEYPDQSATVILNVSGFDSGDAVSLSGPGIPDKREFRASGLSPAFWRAAAVNAARFPLGVDFIFCGPDSLTALPRSSKPAILDAR